MNDVETPFVHRPACELCGSQQAVSLLALPFTAPPVWDYLDDYCEKRVPETVLKGATYGICRCKTCGFLWQASILNDRWMGELYERWISAEASLKKKQAGLDRKAFPLAPVRKGWRVFARSMGVRSYRAVFGTTMLFQKAA